MRLGIDLGTTRTVVAVEDRGNYPVIGFVAPDGDVVEHYATVTAEVDGALVHGPAAVAAARAGAPSLGSWKRLLVDRGADAPVTVGSVTLPLGELVAGFLASLRHDLFTRSNLPKRFSDPLEAVISVPANAHSTQRFVTMDAFHRAGFAVRGVINEPSAAGLEYAHRYRDTISSRREHVVIYDLGGGTFDAAVVVIAGGRHDVLTTSGIARLGGDDFDRALADLALEVAGVARALGPAEDAALLAECRTAKEALNPNSRKLVIDLSALEGDTAVVPVADYYERVRPLVDRTMEALEPVLGLAGAPAPPPDGRAAITDAELAGIYVVGGASGLPLVPRVLRERFGRRVHRSPYPSAAPARGGGGGAGGGGAGGGAGPGGAPATAAGGARCGRGVNRAPNPWAGSGSGVGFGAEGDEPPALLERFTRHLGVFREKDAGARVSFDGIFAKDTPMPAPGAPPLVATRSYRAAHTLGHFRFVECGGIDAAGDPTGDITPHAEVLFPFAPDLRARADLGAAPIERLGNGGGPLIEERYEVDGAGVIAVTITDLDSGFARRFVL